MVSDGFVKSSYDDKINSTIEEAFEHYSSEYGLV